MASWASTDYKIEGNSKDLQEISNFSASLTRAKESHLMSIQIKSGKEILYGL